MVGDVLLAVAETLDRSARVRVFDSAASVQPTRKRRPVLADESAADALVQLRAALACRPDTEVVDWMCWPDLWLELVGQDGATLAVVGLIHPGWLRWEPYGDLNLREPDAIGRWLARWAPTAAAALPA